MAALAQDAAQKLGLAVKPLRTLPSGSKQLKAPRIALFQPPTANMDEGWTRWLLEQYEFSYDRLPMGELKRGGLSKRFDVILFADQSKDSLMKGATQKWYTPEQRGGLGSEGVKALKEFVREGGTLVTLGSASLVPVEEFPLPLKNGLKGLNGNDFSCPGSILRVFVDNRSLVGQGMPEEAYAVYYNDVFFELGPPLGDEKVDVIAKYPASDVLASGWIGGEKHIQDKIAAAEVAFGKGRVVLLGFSVQNRAQPHGTFKLLFNALQTSAMD